MGKSNSPRLSVEHVLALTLLAGVVNSLDEDDVDIHVEREDDKEDEEEVELAIQAAGSD